MSTATDDVTEMGAASTAVVDATSKTRVDNKRKALPRPFPSDVDADTRQPITTDGDRPQKRFYRQRAHCNPLAHNDSYEYPLYPDAMVWQADALYPSNTPPTVLDIGCGFGGLTLSLASVLPNEVILGMEIRAKVTEYVRLRIVAARKDGFDCKEAPNGDAMKAAPNDVDTPQHHYNNCAVMRTNSMKFLPNFFGRGSLRKLFFCFPDPHFKRKNHPRRIVSKRLLDEYAYVLQENARLYCITDVEELHHWHVAACDAHACFTRLFVSTDPNDFDEASDPCLHVMKFHTEEGQKVDRNGGSKYYAVYERVPDTAATVTAESFFATPHVNEKA